MFDEKHMKKILIKNNLQKEIFILKLFYCEKHKLAFFSLRFLFVC